MGESSETVAANSCGSEIHDLGSCQAHHVGISTPEDRGGTKGTVGEDTGCEEGLIGCLLAALVELRLLRERRAPLRLRRFRRGASNSFMLVSCFYLIITSKLLRNLPPNGLQLAAT
jgi:hypothetical protein